MVPTSFVVGDVAVFVSYAKCMPQGWEARIRPIKGNAYLQAVNRLCVIDAEHLGHASFNVVQAHRYGYNKMKSVEAEMVLNLSFKNSFSEAIRLVGVQANHPTALFSFSRDAGESSKSLERATAQLAYEEADEDAHKDQALSYLVSSFGLTGIKDIDDLKGVLIERSAIFYARYRTRAQRTAITPDR